MNRRDLFGQRLIELQGEFRDVPDTQRVFDLLLAGLAVAHAATGGVSAAQWQFMCGHVHQKLINANATGAS
jgi:hypothetical protein